MLDVFHQHALQGGHASLLGTDLSFLLFELGQLLLMETAYSC
jgi:hypothetical protein